MPRKRPTNLTEYASVLKGTGEVSVGAYARVQRRNRILIGLAGLVLISGATGLHLLLRPQDEAKPTRRNPVFVKCVACGYEGVVYLNTGESDLPLRCPKCEQRSCRKVWECGDCRHQFLAKGGPAELQCPQCGSRRVGTAEGPASAGGGE